MSIVRNPNYDEFDMEKHAIIKKYFSRIFTVLTPEIRDQLEKLDLSEQKKKQLKKELAFLTIPKQKEYLKEIQDRKMS